MFSKQFLTLLIISFCGTFAMTQFVPCDECSRDVYKAASLHSIYFNFNFVFFETLYHKNELDNHCKQGIYNALFNSITYFTNYTPLTGTCRTAKACGWDGYYICENGDCIFEWDGME
jgi:hypothetical protein